MVFHSAMIAFLTNYRVSLSMGCVPIWPQLRHLLLPLSLLRLLSPRLFIFRPCWFFIIRSTKTTVFVILYLRSANCLLQYFVDLFDPSLLWLRFSEFSRVPLYLKVARFVCQCQTYLLWRRNWLPHFHNEARSYWFWAIHFELYRFVLLPSWEKIFLFWKWCLEDEWRRVQAFPIIVQMCDHKFPHVKFFVSIPVSPRFLYIIIRALLGSYTQCATNFGRTLSLLFSPQKILASITSPHFVSNWDQNFVFKSLAQIVPKCPQLALCYWVPFVELFVWVFTPEDNRLQCFH